jgi:hypothetical protein
MKNREETDWDELKDLGFADWRRIRGAIEHENLLTNHRMTWLLQSQGFLLASFGFVLQASLSAKPDTVVVYQLVLGSVAFIGITMCLYLRWSLLAAFDQHRALEKWWKAHHPDKNLHPPLCGHDPQTLFQFELPYAAFPVIFIVGWFLFLIIPLWPFIVPHLKQPGVALLYAAIALVILVMGVFIGAGRRRPPT